MSFEGFYYKFFKILPISITIIVRSAIVVTLEEEKGR